MTWPKHAQRKGGRNSPSAKNGAKGGRPQTHGVYAFMANGPDALDTAEIERYSELKRMVKSKPGRRELREELTARAALIVEIAMRDLQQTHEAGDSIWEAPVMKRSGTWFAELRRLLDSFPDDLPEGELADVIAEATNG